MNRFEALRNSPNSTGTGKIVRILSIGTLIVAILLVSMLLTYDLLITGHLRARTYIGLVVIAYTLLSLFMAYRNRTRLASWLIIILYQTLVLGVLVQWGVNAPVGILAICFVTILPGILLGSRYIFPIFAYTLLLLVGTQALHRHGIHSPNLAALSAPSTYWDVAVYATVIAMFALLSWLSENQTEKSLIRAASAEARLRDQKQTIATELKQESIKLRQVQQKQFRQLYQFAIIGQSTAATLHELSNQLSELNFDIDDLDQQNKNSKAIVNAKVTIDHINHTVRQARQQLNNYTSGGEHFNGIAVVNNALEDLSSKFRQRQVTLIKKLPNAKTSAPLFGGPAALSQIISILLNNALDACQDEDGAWVELTLNVNNGSMRLIVTDSGPGISESARKSIFKPKASTKPSGLGVGLYIAKQLIVTQFQGTIALASNSLGHGAQFIVTIPLTSPESQPLDEE